MIVRRYVQKQRLTSQILGEIEKKNLLFTNPRIPINRSIRKNLFEQLEKSSSNSHEKIGRYGAYSFGGTNWNFWKGRSAMLGAKDWRLCFGWNVVEDLLMKRCNVGARAFPLVHFTGRCNCFPTIAYKKERYLFMLWKVVFVVVLYY